MTIFQHVANRIILRAMRTPYWHLPGYMNRYWLVPFRTTRSGHGSGPVNFFKRPIAWLLQRLNVAVRVHHIMSSDDRVFHDHPWNYCTVILRGGYFECTPHFDSSGIYAGEKAKWCGPGTVLFRKAKHWHRLEIDHSVGPCWTLFISGPWKQRWGFMPTPDMNKTDARDYRNRKWWKG